MFFFKCFTLVGKLVVKEGNPRCVWWKTQLHVFETWRYHVSNMYHAARLWHGKQEHAWSLIHGKLKQIHGQNQTSPCHVNGNALQWQLKRLHLNNKLASLRFKQMLVRFAGAGRQINTFLAPSITKGPSHGRTVDLVNCQWLANKLEHKLSTLSIHHCH